MNDIFFITLQLKSDSYIKFEYAKIVNIDTFAMTVEVL